MPAEVSDFHGRVQHNMMLMVVKVNQFGWTMFNVKEVRLPFWTVPEMHSEIITVVTVKM